MCLVEMERSPKPGITSPRVWGLMGSGELCYAVCTWDGSQDEYSSRT